MSEGKESTVHMHAGDVRDQIACSKPVKRSLSRSNSGTSLNEERQNPFSDAQGRAFGIYHEDGRINHERLPATPPPPPSIYTIPGLIFGALLGLVAGDIVIPWLLNLMGPSEA